MAKIMGFTTKPKASSVVGTPGADLSTAQALNTVNQTTKIFIDKFNKNEAVTRTVNALKTAQDINSNAGTELAAIQGRANADSTIDTEIAIKEQQTNYDKTVKKELSNIKNNKLRKLTEFQLAKDRASVFNSIAKWGIKRGAIVALDNGTESINTLATFAEKVTTTADLNSPLGLLKKAEEISTSTAAVLEQKQGLAFIKGAPKKVIRGYLKGRMIENPFKALHDFKKDPFFVGKFDPKETAQIEEDLLNAIKGLNPMVELAAAFGNTVEEEKLADLMLNRADPQEFREARDNAEANNVLTESLEKGYAKAQELSLTKRVLRSPSTLEAKSNLKADYLAISKALDMDQKVLLETILKFKIRVREQVADGFLAPTTATNWLALMKMPTRQKITEITDSRGLGLVGPRRAPDDAAEWDFRIPIISVKVQSKLFAESFRFVSDLASDIAMFFTGFGFRSERTAIVKGFDRVDGYVNSINLKKDTTELIRDEMTETFVTDVANLKLKGLDQDLEFSDIEEILTKRIPEINARFGLAEIPEKGLPFFFKGRKYRKMPDGKIMYEGVQ